MAKVTVGVPVYNGVDLIGDSLDCLARQSFRDLEIIISDNASTDGTSDICAAFAARDGRFRHIRHETTSGPMENFLFVRDQATSPFFMWRAYDDLSDDRYVETLLARLEASPEAALAVATCHSKGGRKPGRTVGYRADDDGMRLLRIYRQIFFCHPGWFYGLWRTDACRRITQSIYDAYPDPWASDRMAIFYAALADGVRGAPEAEFVQRVTNDAPAYLTVSPKEMADQNRRFAAACRVGLQASALPAWEKLALRMLLPFYVNKRSHSLKRRIRAWKAQRR